MTAEHRSNQQEQTARWLSVPSDPVTYVANRKECLLAAFRTVYDAYLRIGLVKPNRVGLRILPQQLLDTNWVIVTERDGQVAGTVSVIETGALGLPMGLLYPLEIARVQRQAKRVAELTCLATSTSVKSGSTQVLRDLLHAAVHLAVVRRIDYLTLCIHPRQARFYRQRLGFEAVGPVRRCPWVCEQPAIALGRPVAGLVKNALVESGGQGPSSPHWLVPRQAERECRESLQDLLDEACPLRWPSRRSLAA
jgi:N-acyl amino acid synthase FeeM